MTFELDNKDEIDSRVAFEFSDVSFLEIYGNITEMRWLCTRSSLYARVKPLYIVLPYEFFLPIAFKMSGPGKVPWDQCTYYLSV